MRIVPENRDFEPHSLHPESIPHVVLRHDRAGRRDWLKPYHIEPLSRYCARPPRNPAFKLLGIYPSERTGLAAMDKDWKCVRAQLLALGKPGKEARP